MNYYLNPEDEKKLNEEIQIQNQALDDIINNQQTEEQLVKMIIITLIHVLTDFFKYLELGCVEKTLPKLHVI